MRIQHGLRALAIPAALVVGLLGASAVSAAEPSASGSVTVVGSGTLAAGGAGVAHVRGTFVITGSMRGGTLVIDGIDRTTAIRVTGWRAKVRIDADTLLYRHVFGSFTVAGRTIRVTITSPATRFVAAGTGAASLRGIGWYRIDGGATHRWTRHGTHFPL
jgi:hypothetical protein